MNTKYKFENDHTNKIFYKHFFGTITIEDILTSWDEAITERIIPVGTKRFIINFKYGTAIYKPENPKLLANYYNGRPETFKGARIAIVTVKPEDIIVPMLLKQEKGLFSLAPFSTEEAAIEWVMETE